MSYIREEIRRVKTDAQLAIERAKTRISPRASEGEAELVKRLRTKYKALKTQKQTKPRRKRRHR